MMDVKGSAVSFIKTKKKSCYFFCWEFFYCAKKIYEVLMVNVTLRISHTSSMNNVLKQAAVL